MGKDRRVFSVRIEMKCNSVRHLRATRCSREKKVCSCIACVCEVARSCVRVVAREARASELY